MAHDLTGTLGLIWALVNRNDTAVVGVRESFSPRWNQNIAYAEAGGEDTAFCVQKVTVAASSNLQLGLRTAGDFINQLGEDCIFSKVFILAVRDLGATGEDDSLFAPASTNGFVDWLGGTGSAVFLKSGSFFVICASPLDPWVPTAAQHRIHLQNTDAGASRDFELLVAGVIDE